MLRLPRRRRAARLGVEPLEGRELLAVGDVLVGFAPRVTPAAARRTLARFGLEAVDQAGGAVVARPKAAATATDAAALARRVDRAAGVRYAEADALIRPEAIYPSDVNFPASWGLNNGANTDVDAPEAWSLAATSGPPTLVAIIDSGLDITHPDLADRVWVNAREIPDNGIDDDRNGYADDVQGWNFLQNNGNVLDDDGHGTHIAGIIAAAGNGGGPAVGLDWRARLLPLKFIDALGNGTLSDAVKAVDYAVAAGARVINASWGGPENSAALEAAIRRAAARGVVFVTAAGNEATNNDRRASYPSSLLLTNVLSVAAVDPSGRLASFSNYGLSVDVAAPGVSITSTIPGGTASYSGTSMATPFVAGVAALLIEKHPDWTAAQVVGRITATAKRLPGLTGLVASGLVSAGRALDPNVLKLGPKARARARLRARRRAARLRAQAHAHAASVVAIAAAAVDAPVEAEGIVVEVAAD